MRDVIEHARLVLQKRILCTDEDGASDQQQLVELLSRELLWFEHAPVENVRQFAARSDLKGLLTDAIRAALLHERALISLGLADLNADEEQRYDEGDVADQRCNSDPVFEAHQS